LAHRVQNSASGPLLHSPAAIGPRRWNLLLGVALIALVVRLVYIKQISDSPFYDLRLGDAAAYHQWALRIAGGDWLGTGVGVFYQAPLYPYFLAVVYNAFGDSAALLRFIQAVIGAGSCMLLGAAGMALFGEYGALAGALLALYPPAIFLDGLLDKSALVTFFTVGLLYLLSARHVRFREFLSGVVLGLLSLTRENALLLAVPVLLWFAAGKQLRWSGARNRAVGGEFQLTTSQFGSNFYIGNHAGAQGLYEPLVPGHGSAADERDDAARLAAEASGRTLSPGEVSAFWTRRALEFIRTQPGAWLGQLARKLALTWNAAEIADTESQDVYAEWSPAMRALAPFSFGVVFCLAAFGVFTTLDAWRRVWFLYAVAFTYTLSIVTFFVFARYRFPLVPVLLLFAAGGMAAWRQPAARPMWRWGFAALVLAGGLTYLPLVSTRVNRVAHYVNIANAFVVDPTKRGEAAAFFDKALREAPESPAAHFGMGVLMVQQDRPREAVAHYQTALAGWPDNADLRLNYALALANAGDNQRAFEQLDAAAGLRPGDPTAYVVFGKLLLKESRPADALKAYERALAIQPGNPDALTGSAASRTQLQRP
jgi:tetratricopeptide (TPR) repeat protein